MKTRILFFCISCLLWASCENSRQNYVIEGTLPSVKYDGEWIYFVLMENAPGRVDSVKITNASFSFSGQGEEMRVLRLRHLLRIYIQELLVVTEPGTIHVKAYETSFQKLSEKLITAPRNWLSQIQIIFIMVPELGYV